MARRLGLEITHLCNQYCPLCDHRILSSDYKYLTLDEYDYIRSCVNPNDVTAITVIGGEPLCHPQFEMLIARITQDFPSKKVTVWTNAKLLPRFIRKHPNRPSNLHFLATRYKGFNDKAFKALQGVKHIRWLPKDKMHDPYRDPNLSEEDAKALYARCIKHQARVIGLRLYGCPNSESIERYYHTPVVHVMFTENWLADVEKLEVWKACQHCFRGCPGVMRQ